MGNRNTHVTVKTLTIGTDASGAPLRMKGVTDCKQLRDGRFIVVVRGEHCLYVLRPNKSLERILGRTPGKEGHKDGAGTDALFNLPYFATVVGLDYAFVTDQYNHCIRRVCLKTQDLCRRHVRGNPRKVWLHRRTRQRFEVLLPVRHRFLRQKQCPLCCRCRQSPHPRDRCLRQWSVRSHISGLRGAGPR